MLQGFGGYCKQYIGKQDLPWQYILQQGVSSPDVMWDWLKINYSNHDHCTQVPCQSVQQCGSLVCFQLFLENIGVSYTNAMFIFLDCSALTAQEESTWVSYMPEEKRRYLLLYSHNLCPNCAGWDLLSCSFWWLITSTGFQFTYSFCQCCCSKVLVCQTPALLG